MSAWLPHGHAAGPSPDLSRLMAPTPPTVVEAPVLVQAPNAAPPPAVAPAVSMAVQPVTVQQGTGVLLRLPAPAGTVMSADPNVARVQPASPTSLFLMGVAPGRTTIIATSETGNPVAQYDVTVSPGRPATAPPQAQTGLSPATAAAVQSAIAQTVNGARDVRVRAAGSELIIVGVVPNALAAQQVEAIAKGYISDKVTVVNNITVLGSIQVNVRVRVAEMSRQITRQLGFNWQALGGLTTNSFRFGLRTGAAAGALYITPLLPLGGSPLPNATSAPYQVGSGFTSGNGNWDVNQVIDALAGDRLISILAEPNLTAQSGETASFLAGGEFPIPVAGVTSNGATTITVAFKQYGVSLAFVPTVLSPGRLNLRVRPEVSELTQTGAINVPIQGGTLTIPALVVRRAETTVELGSGQSFAIAGLLSKSSIDSTSALPGIGELPVIGALFKSNDFQRGETELVIIVTPYLVQAANSPSDLAAPTDRFRPATDLDRILYGRQIAPGAGTPARVDAGFILK
ncbi:MAG: type II and III secretion system protein family protein [Acetobacteraceae bacterium]|nr:type II and III secretion system protein family protein [Pseudomonadota bacterium]